MKKILTLVLLGFSFLAGLTSQVSAGGLEAVFAAYQEKIFQYQLANGMRFVILEDKIAPVVTFHVQVRAGSVYEQPGETGINHLIEHLAFSGTNRIGATDWRQEKKLLGRLDQLHWQIIQAREKSKPEELKALKSEFEKIRRQAASLAEPSQFSLILDREGAVGPNAYVSNDFTVYWVELPSNKFELWACLESERLFNSVFRLFYEEIEIVKEERRSVVDNSPVGSLMEEFRQAAYLVHPYRYPVIGYMNDIKAMNRARVKQLYQKYYLPSNILISIVGDVSAQEIKPLLEKYFGRQPAREKPCFNLPEEPPRVAERRVLLQRQAQPVLLIGYNIPAAGHSDLSALMVASEIIGGGPTSRLYRYLVKEKQVAAAVSSWVRRSRYPGLFYIWAITADGFSNSCLEPLIYSQIKAISLNPPTLAEVEAAQSRLKMNFIQNLQSRRNLASNLAWFQEVTGSWENFFKIQEEISRVEPQDVLRVIQAYLRQNNRTVGSLEPLVQEK